MGVSEGTLAKVFNLVHKVGTGGVEPWHPSDLVPLPCGATVGVITVVR